MTVTLASVRIEPTEIILTGALFGALSQNRRRKLMDSYNLRDEITQQRCLRAKKVLFSAIVPYVIWQSVCVLLGFFLWPDPDFSRSGLRFLVSGVFPWVIILIFILRPNVAQQVLRYAIMLAMITACIHILIQVFDYRPIMELAYWRFSNLGELSWGDQDRLRMLIEAEFLRGLPQGIMMILFFAIFYWAKLQESQKKKFVITCAFMILTVAISITITRSLMVLLIVGCIIASIITASAKGIIRLKVFRNIIILIVIIAITGFVYDVVRPGFVGEWENRITALSKESDAKILSYENKARGLDNIASLHAIADNPWLGLGITLYPTKYSLRSGEATDSHPLIVVALVGGLPAVILLLRLLLMILWHFGRYRFINKANYSEALPLIAVLITAIFFVNTIGGGGTLFGNGLIIMCIFISALVDINIHSKVAPNAP